MRPDAASGWLAQEDVEAFLAGLALLGTGGGGAPALGRAILTNDMARGRSYQVSSPNEVPDEALVVSGGIMGSVRVLDRFSPEEIVATWEECFEPMDALRAMEDHLGRRVDFLVPFELGGVNTSVILSLGARAGIPVVNGDGLGRAAPETQMTSFAGHGVPIVPMPLVDRQGNLVVVKESSSPFFPDEVGRYVVTRTGGFGANTHYPMRGVVLRGVVVPDTLSLALRLGRRVSSLSQAEERAQAVAAELGGRLVFHGVVRELTEADATGFLVQTVTVAGTGRDRGALLEVAIKNEFMLASKDGEVGCIFPDLILMVDGAGRAVMSSELCQGQEVWVVLAPCAPRLREAALSPEGQLAMGPERFGRPDLVYRPVEEFSERWGTKW